MLVNPTAFIKRARLQGRAVAAFNVHNMEILQGVATAAETVDCPLIIQASPATVAFAGSDYLVAMATTAARRGLTVALHLDHATDIELIAECLQAGFTSVMYDGSRLPLEENMENTRRVVRLAKTFGAAVEAELGHVGKSSYQHDDSLFTSPSEADRFVNLTGIDFLAVAVGTVHGLYKGEPKLDFPRLREIYERARIPLVLHGGSGVPCEAIRKAISLGVAKVNIATELKVPFTQTLMDELQKLAKESKGSYDPRLYMEAARASVTRTALEKTEMCWLADTERSACNK